jgi:ligand-binding SRPBCC domain-containing protein
MPAIHLETLIEAPREVCFDLMRDVDAHIASTAGSGERAVAGRTTGLFETGDTVTWEARHLGIRHRMTVRVTRCEPPELFVDEMVSGPFRSFTHAHRFLAEPTATRMVDDFDYVSPLGLLGRLADRLFLERHMRRFLQERALFLRKAAEERARSRRTPAR